MSYRDPRAQNDPRLKYDDERYSLLENIYPNNKHGKNLEELIDLSFSVLSQHGVEIRPKGEKHPSYVSDGVYNLESINNFHVFENEETYYSLNYHFTDDVMTVEVQFGHNTWEWAGVRLLVSKVNFTQIKLQADNTFTVSFEERPQFFAGIKTPDAQPYSIPVKYKLTNYDEFNTFTNVESFKILPTTTVKTHTRSVGFGGAYEIVSTGFDVVYPEKHYPDTHNEYIYSVRVIIPFLYTPFILRLNNIWYRTHDLDNSVYLRTNTWEKVPKHNIYWRPSVSQGHSRRRRFIEPYNSQIQETINLTPKERLVYDPNDLTKSRFILKNEITNGDFESSGNWTLGGVEGTTDIVSVYKMFGSKSLKISVNNQNGYVFQDISGNRGNRIYLSGYTRLDTYTRGTPAIAIRKYNSFDGGTNIVANTSIIGSWQRFSATIIIPADSNGFRIIVGAPGTSAFVCNFDGIFAVDLTATFGAGNEPSNEEMDTIIEEIDYFEGERQLTIEEAKRFGII